MKGRMKKPLRQVIDGIKPLVQAVPSADRSLRSVRDHLALLKHPKQTPMGFRFSGNRLMAQGGFEPDETDLVRQTLKTTDVFINIGANIGYYCCIALHAGVRTIAIEPVRSNLRFLYRNIAVNGWQNVEVFPVALSNRSGLIPMYGGGTGASTIEGWAGNPLHTRRWVPSMRLDDLFQDRFAGKRCFYLVDIEGAEKFMLEGADGQLAQSPKPVWMMEITTTQHQPVGTVLNPNLQSTFETFWENGYTAWTADSARRPVTEADIQAVCSGRRADLGADNFLFMEDAENDGRL